MNINWWRWLIAMGFAIEETCYFGWRHLMPTSNAEMICDGIFAILLVLSFQK